MQTVREPALFCSIYVHRHLPGFLRRDPRLVLLEMLETFADRHELAPFGTLCPHTRPSEIDLVALHRAPPAHRPLVWLSGPEGSDPLYEALAYAHADSLVLHLHIGRSDAWCRTLAEGWQELSVDLRSNLDAEALEAAMDRTFGMSVVYWATAVAGDDASVHDASARRLFEPSVARPTETDIGALWRCERPLYPELSRLSQDAWLLVTPPGAREESEANRRYANLRGDGPPDFTIVALALHKFAFEWREFADQHEELGRIRRSLDRRAHWILDTQRYYGSQLGELDTRESAEFQEKLARAANSLGDYRGTVSRIKELSRTLWVSRTNFLVHSTALVSADGADRVAAAADQEAAAADLLNDRHGHHEEEIFRRELGLMQGKRAQVTADIDYAERLIERYEAAVEAGGERLRMGEVAAAARSASIARVEVAAAVAALAAVVAVELLQLFPDLGARPLVAINLLLLSATTSFAIVLGLAGVGRIRTRVDRGSMCAAAGCVAGAGFALGAGADPTPGLFVANAAVIASGAVGAWILQSVWSIRRRTLAEDRRRRRRRVMADLAKLRYAEEELPDLLEDVPPASTYRIKDEGSLLRKVEERNRRRAAQLGIPPEELSASGRAYTATDVRDAIGVRYVVAPWRIPEIVRRVTRVTHALAIEYKDTAMRIGRRAAADGRGPETDDPTYRGRYRGLLVKYRSVHIDIDLWGVGAHKDVGMMAEIQIRTPIQDRFAAWFHDILYKEPESEPRGGTGEALRSRWRRRAEFPLKPFRHLAAAARAARRPRGPGAPDGPHAPGAPWVLRFFHLWHPWLNRPIARFLVWLADVEMRLFRRSMGWNEPPESGGPRETEAAGPGRGPA